MTTIQGVHPYADKFPMLPESELAELAESIKQNGLRQPIVLTEDGFILDGRNRAKACELAGVDPVTVMYEGDDLAEYVIDSNSNRRHMTSGQMYMCDALVFAEAGLRANGRWARGTVAIGSSSNISARRKGLDWAGTVIDYAPHLIDQVVSGDLALDKAVREAERARDAERHRLEREERIRAEEEDAKAFVESNAPDLAAQVGDFFQSFAEAKAVWEKRNREEAERLAREKAEKERHEKEVRRSLTAMYSDGIGKALSTLGEYGQAENPVAVMDRFNKSLLHPPMIERYYTTENIRAVQRFVNALLEWSENQ